MMQDTRSSISGPSIISGKPIDIDCIPAADRVILNIGGAKFIVSRLNLRRYPYTRLGRLSMARFTSEFYFDRNPKLFMHVLDLYRTGELHIPRHYCSMSVKAELDFWDIPPSLVSECCWTAFTEGTHNKAVVDDIEKSLRNPYEKTKNRNRIRDHIWNTMTNQEGVRYAPVRHQLEEKSDPSEKENNLSSNDVQFEGISKNAKNIISANKKIFCHLVRGHSPGHSKHWTMIYNIFATVSVAIFVLDSVPHLRYIPDHVAASLYGDVPVEGEFRYLMYSVSLPEVHYVDVCCWIFFSVEFCVRLYVCPDRKIFIKSKLNWLDLMLVVVAWLAFMLEEGAVKHRLISLNSIQFFYLLLFLRGLKSLRVLRICHFMTGNEYIRVMLLSMKASLYPLTLLMGGVMIVALLFGVLMYVAELSWGKFTFNNIGIGAWWGFATMLAIGYGDIVPDTLPGYLIAIMCGCVGVVLLAMPIAIISANFKAYMVSLKTYRHRQQRLLYLHNMELPMARRKLSLFIKDRKDTHLDPEKQYLKNSVSGVSRTSQDFRILYNV